MGFAVGSKGAPLAGLLKKFLLAAPAAPALGPASVAGGCRLFNTGAPPHPRDDVINESNGEDEFVFYDSRLLAPGFSYPSSVELELAMLGLGKDQVKVSACQNSLLVKGEGIKKSDGDQDPASYSCRIYFSADAFKLDQTKAEIKDGVLKVIVPKKAEVYLECTDIKVE